MSNDNSSIAINAIMVESDGQIILAGTGGLLFLNSDGSLNTDRGDADGGYGRTGECYGCGAVTINDDSPAYGIGCASLNLTGPNSCGSGTNGVVIAYNDVSVDTYTCTATQELVLYTADGELDTSYSGPSGALNFSSVAGLTVASGGQLYIGSVGGSGNTFMQDTETVVASRVYVQQDSNFNVTAILDGSGNVLERYRYSPYGAVTVMNAEWTVQSGSVLDWKYLHQGERLDDLIQGYDSRNRIRKTNGTFLTAEPSGAAYVDGANLYEALGSNPINRKDPSGLFTVEQINALVVDGTPLPQIPSELWEGSPPGNDPYTITNLGTAATLFLDYLDASIGNSAIGTLGMSVNHALQDPYWSADNVMGRMVLNSQEYRDVQPQMGDAIRVQLESWARLHPQDNAVVKLEHAILHGYGTTLAPNEVARNMLLGGVTFHADGTASAKTSTCGESIRIEAKFQLSWHIDDTYHFSKSSKEPGNFVNHVFWTGLDHNFV